MARLEAAFDVTGRRAFKRPVVRIPGEHGALTVFTRIDPAAAATSMIVRVRGGWDALRALLLSGPDAAPARSPQQRRYDTYVCTAAEQPYALEVRGVQEPCLYLKVSCWPLLRCDVCHVRRERERR